MAVRPAENDVAPNTIAGTTNGVLSCNGKVTNDRHQKSVVISLCTIPYDCRLIIYFDTNSLLRSVKTLQI